MYACRQAFLFHFHVHLCTDVGFFLQALAGLAHGVIQLNMQTVEYMQLPAEHTSLESISAVFAEPVGMRNMQLSAAVVLQICPCSLQTSMGRLSWSPILKPLASYVHARLSITSGCTSWNNASLTGTPAYPVPDTGEESVAQSSDCLLHCNATGCIQQCNFMTSRPAFRRNGSSTEA